MDELFFTYYHVVAAFLLCILFFHGFSRLSDVLIHKEKGSLRSVFVRTLRIPLLVLPWLLVVFYVSYAWPGVQERDFSSLLILVRKVMLLLYVAWVGWEISDNAAALLKSSGSRLARKMSSSVVSRTIQLLILILVTLHLLKLFGYSLSALLAFGGVGGIILGFAAKDWLANFFGGLMLMLDRPFTEGDWIRSPDRAIEGHVEKVGWRLTKIRTFDRRPIYVPNSIFSGIVVENPSRMRNRRMVEEFSLNYEDLPKMPDILATIDRKVSELPDVDAVEPHYAAFIRYGDSGLICQIRAHITQVDRVDFLQVQESVLLLVANIVTEAGASFAYPTRRILSDPQS